MAKLGKEDMEALEDYYKRRDLYDPSKDPKQEPPTFTPKMCEGGEMGYADGGTVDLSLSPDDEDAGQIATRKTPVPGVNGPMPGDLDDDAGIPTNVQDAANEASADAVLGKPEAPLKDALISQPGAIQEAPQAPAKASKLSPDEYADLIRSLRPSRGQGIAQGAFSGLAGLADAIETGVARAGGSNFQKNIMEGQQQQKENLINALKAKYEKQFRGEELAQGAGRLTEEQRAHQAEETQRGKSLQEEKRQHDLEAGQRGATLKLEQSKENRQAAETAAKNKVEAAQKIVEAYEKSGYSPFAARPSQTEYNEAKKVLINNGAASGVVRIKDSAGKLHDLPAASLEKAKQRDPGLTVISNG